MFWPDTFAAKGQVIAACFALMAAIVSIVATIASQKVTARSDAELIRAGKIIERLDHQVRVTIGGEWQPLTIGEIIKLVSELKALNMEGRKVQVLYENEFGKQLATSIALAFENAKWQVLCCDKSTVGNGIEVGNGSLGIRMRTAIINGTPLKEVRAVRTDTPEQGISFVSVGAKTE